MLNLHVFLWNISQNSLVLTLFRAVQQNWHVATGATVLHRLQAVHLGQDHTALLLAATVRLSRSGPEIDFCQEMATVSFSKHEKVHQVPPNVNDFKSLCHFDWQIHVHLRHRGVLDLLLRTQNNFLEKLTEDRLDDRFRYLKQDVFCLVGFQGESRSKKKQNKGLDR